MEETPNLGIPTLALEGSDGTRTVLVCALAIVLVAAMVPPIATAISSNPVGGWEQEAKITPDDADEPGPTGTPAHAWAAFGAETSIDGDLLAVGTATSASAEYRVAYLFERIENGSWIQIDRLTPRSQPDRHHGFGYAVAVDEDARTVVVGDPGYDREGHDGAGAAIVFEENAEGEWVQTAHLVSPNLASENDWGPEFGKAVAIDDDTIVVGASDAVVEANKDSGKVYVYNHNGDSWNRSVTLSSPQAIERGFFGRALAIEDGRLAVAAQGEPAGGLPGVGAAYIFEDDSGSWREAGRLTPPDPGGPRPGARCFGFDLDLAGRTVVVGDPCWRTRLDANNPTSAYTGFVGSAYVYESKDVGWMLDAQLFGSRTPESLFGTSVAVDESQASLVVGARDGPVHGQRTGAGYVFEEDSSEWEKEASLGSDTSSNDRFGWAVSMSEKTAVVGAPGDDNRRDGTPWPLNDVGGIPYLSRGQSAGSVYVWSEAAGGMLAADLPSDGDPPPG